MGIAHINEEFAVCHIVVVPHVTYDRFPFFRAVYSCKTNTYSTGLEHDYIFSLKAMLFFVSSNALFTENTPCVFKPYVRFMFFFINKHLNVGLVT